MVNTRSAQNSKFSQRSTLSDKAPKHAKKKKTRIQMSDSNDELNEEFIPIRTPTPTPTQQTIRTPTPTPTQQTEGDDEKMGADSNDVSNEDFVPLESTIPTSTEPTGAAIAPNAEISESEDHRDVTNDEDNGDHVTVLKGRRKRRTPKKSRAQRKRLCTKRNGNKVTSLYLDDEADDASDSAPIPESDNIPKKSKAKGKEFNNRMSPNGLFQLIGKLSDKQKDAVKEIGFGGFLYLETDNIPSKLALWLLRTFDTCSRSLALQHGDRLRVSKEDVYLTLGLPMGPVKVVQAASENDGSPEFKNLLKSWKEQWPELLSLPKLGDMASMIESQVEGGDDFKRNFIVFVVSTCLYGNQHGEANVLILNALLDLSKVKDMDWAHYTIEALVASVDEWQSKQSRFFRGPILFLMLCYLDRVVFKLRSVERKFPTLRGWTSEEIKLRGRQELDAGIGRGWLEDRLDSSNIGEEQQLDHEQENENVRQKGERADTRLKDQATESLVKAVVQKATSMADDVLDRIGEMKEVVRTLEELLAGTAKEASPSKPDGVPALAPDSYESEAFLIELDALEKSISTVKAAASQFPQFTPPTFSLGISQEENLPRPDDVIHLDAVVQQIATSSKEAKDKKGIPQEDNHPRPDDVTVLDPVVNQVAASSQQAKDRKEKRKAMAGKHEYPRRENRGLARALCSPYLRRNVNIFSTISYEVKLYADYAFNLAEPESQVLYEDGYYAASRGMLYSLADKNLVDHTIVSIWASIMNDSEQMRDKSDVHRVFFSKQAFNSYFALKKSEKEATDKFMRQVDTELSLSPNVRFEAADLVFFHVTSNEEHLVLCFNFKHNFLDVIDHRIRKDHDLYVYLISILRSLVRLLCKKKNDAKKENALKKLKMRVLEMPWQTEDFQDDHHAAIYAMRHMEVYKGSVNSWSDFGLKKNDASGIHRLRVKYCHKIMVSRTNAIVDDVKKSVAIYEKSITP